ncbi:dihydrodipicolinate synthase family protein [Jeotgalibacillus soli]|uniref:Dihydrodipicolinate synthetase n=1 Tax=Jeotgalibacillus soli TaxID=889306 RepID=A0A0C2VZN8_9BACL|nr:dihydrodipicolinate synthase family protein [Jeotgalibacillus soli]KIL49841.1 dihydrodipicolinate synthetase [Jeotgalibacillus soli]
MALSSELHAFLHEGTVIPAHPLALDEKKELDEEAQRRLTRYYIEAGAGGIAVGVHTTQFEIRDPKHGLLEPVLRMAAEEIEKAKLTRPFLKIAGVCGPTELALHETELAKSFGYDLALLSNGGLTAYTEEELLERTREVAKVLPVFGFYLQPSVGGRVFSFNFWKQFAEIPNVLAIKMAPFNRYQTLDVVRAVCESSRADEIALYTGNDDNIVIDLLTTYSFLMEGKIISKPIVGGLLGHWAVWTQKAVELFNEIKEVRKLQALDSNWLTVAQQVTDSNAAFFDAANQYKGCIAGINEVLARQGLIKGNWCLSDHEVLSQGQAEEIDRIYAIYPDLHDDQFVREFLVQSR